MKPATTYRAYTNYRADGWPLCPRCDEDELWGIADVVFYPRLPTMAEHLMYIRGCYRCNWKPPVSFNPSPHPARLRQ